MEKEWVGRGLQETDRILGNVCFESYSHDIHLRRGFDVSLSLPFTFVRTTFGHSNTMDDKPSQDHINILSFQIWIHHRRLSIWPQLADIGLEVDNVVDGQLACACGLAVVGLGGVVCWACGMEKFRACKLL